MIGRAEVSITHLEDCGRQAEATRHAVVLHQAAGELRDGCGVVALQSTEQAMSVWQAAV